MNKLLYYVEGETEKSFINSLKTKYLKSGRVQQFNFWEECISNKRMRLVEANIIIIIFDTDKYNEKSTEALNIFKENIKKLKKYKANIKKIILISQNKNLEDEVVTCTNIRKILDFYGVENKNKHKSKIINDKNLLKSLEEKEFDLLNLWQVNCLAKEIQSNKVYHGKKNIQK